MCLWAPLVTREGPGQPKVRSCALVTCSSWSCWQTPSCDEEPKGFGRVSHSNRPALWQLGQLGRAPALTVLTGLAL